MVLDVDPSDDILRVVVWGEEFGDQEFGGGGFVVIPGGAMRGMECPLPAFFPYGSFPRRGSANGAYTGPAASQLAPDQLRYHGTYVPVPGQDTSSLAGSTIDMFYQGDGGCSKFTVYNASLPGAKLSKAQYKRLLQNSERAQADAILAGLAGLLQNAAIQALGIHAVNAKGKRQAGDRLDGRLRERVAHWADYVKDERACELGTRTAVPFDLLVPGDTRFSRILAAAIVSIEAECGVTGAVSPTSFHVDANLQNLPDPSTGAYEKVRPVAPQGSTLYTDTPLPALGCSLRLYANWSVGVVDFTQTGHASGADRATANPLQILNGPQQRPDGLYGSLPVCVKTSSGGSKRRRTDHNRN